MKYVEARNIKATSNEVIDHFADLGAQFKIKLLERTEVLIEADALGMEFLANILLAYANGDEHSINIGPKGRPGSGFFKKGSTKGVYLHLLPCRHGHPED